MGLKMLIHQKIRSEKNNQDLRTDKHETYLEV